MTGNSDRHEWYGWIPTLTGVRDTVLSTSDLDDVDGIAYTADDKHRPTRLTAMFDSDQGPVTVGVRIERGFIIVDSMTDQGYAVDISGADFIYSDLKRRFHMDVTHRRDKGLLPVQAGNLGEAARLIAVDFMKAIEWMSPYINNMDDMGTLAQWYQKSKAMYEYGRVYVELNGQLLGDLHQECVERLRTSEVFLEGVYNTTHDMISQNASDSMAQGSDRMEAMTDSVILLTMISVSVALCSAIFSATDIDSPLLAMVVLMLFVDTPLLWMVHSRFWRGNLGYTIMLSTVANLASVAYILVVGVLVGTLILILLDDLCGDLGFNLLFCLFTLAVMTIAGFVLRATCLSEEEMEKRLRKAGLDISTE